MGIIGLSVLEDVVEMSLWGELLLLSLELDSLDIKLLVIGDDFVEVE